MLLDVFTTSCHHCTFIVPRNMLGPTMLGYVALNVAIVWPGLNISMFLKGLCGKSTKLIILLVQKINALLAFTNKRKLNMVTKY